MKIKYTAHLLLISRFKLLYTLIMYLFTLFTYNFYFQDFIIVECMNRQPIDPNLTPIAPNPLNILDYVHNLESEIARLNSRVNLLEQGLRHNFEGRIRERAYYESTLSVVLKENMHLRTNLTIAHNRITEISQLSNRLMQENANLQNLVEQNIAGYTTGLESNSDNS